VLIRESSEQISYFACSAVGPSWEREKDTLYSQRTVPWLRQSVGSFAMAQSVGGCAMAQAVSRRYALAKAVSWRLCHGSGSQSVVVPWLRRSVGAMPWLRQSVGGCAVAQAVSRWLCHDSGGQTAVCLG